ncbi:outer membrane beta-barrel protein [Thalassotalea marina]|uniref:Outer membrane protein beta-barrel domain-containing protein n=1 Tax=Thalassotalea marina TaxID=1673741 RepID=A0A919BG31_9GAMM|nr:outer membrane beta-barrel protein [Thalassotalea marina]GHF88580.1 hypothetical protein GCM10017161_15400 [Thalassotalea marina]
MPSIKSFPAISLGLLLGLSSTAVLADDNYFEFMNDTKVYTGVGYGQYSFQWKDRSNDTSFDDDAAMIKAYIGAAFNPYISTELAYLNFDEVSDFDNTAEFDGYSLALRFSAPLNETVALYAKGGWMEWDTDYKTRIPEVGAITGSDSGGDWFYGVGAGLALTQDINVRLEYERYEIDQHINPDMDVASISVEYVF